MDLLDKRNILEETCPKHGTKLWEMKYPNRDTGTVETSIFCPTCTADDIALTEKELLQEATNRQSYISTYDVLLRESIVPNELRGATFDNFKAESTEERQMLAFVKQQAEKYLAGMTGNTLITGQTGIGKSHLCFALAKHLNEAFKEQGNPKSILFVSLTEIIKQIKQGWNFGKNAVLTEFEAVKLLSGVDYLILDDLGAKNATINPKSDWEQDFLFDILNNRETTIFNTNLSSAELKTVYNARNASRILKGLDGNSFKAFSITDKRYIINKLKQGEQTK
ncbi:ATP-binding protein [Streptococcus suis]|nr:ATP-binding protein [Streptococcus suis]